MGEPLRRWRAFHVPAEFTGSSSLLALGKERRGTSNSAAVRYQPDALGEGDRGYPVADLSFAFCIPKG